MRLVKIDLYSLWSFIVGLTSPLLDPSRGSTWPLTSMIGINENFNFIQQLPPLSLIEILILPLGLCFPFQQASLPLWHQWKRVTSFNNITLPIAKHYCFAEDEPDQNGKEVTPNCCRRYSKVSLGRGLVKISTICSFVPIYSNLMFFFVTFFQRKWNLIGICLVLECITGFLEMLIALMLSHRIRTDHHVLLICLAKFVSPK